MSRCSPSTSEIDLEPRRPHLPDQGGEVGDPRLWRQRRRTRRCAACRPDAASRSARCVPIRSIVVSTSRVDSFAGSSTRRSAPACTTIIDTWCAITSCNSRAIRARSSMTASRFASSRSRSARRSRRSRSPTTRRSSTITTTAPAVNGATAVWKIVLLHHLGRQVRHHEEGHARRRTTAQTSTPRARTAHRTSAIVTGPAGRLTASPVTTSRA